MKENWIWIAIGAVGLWWAYEQGFFSSLLPAATSAAAPASNVALGSAVQLNQGSNSFSAQVFINGVAQPVTLGISTGIAEDQNGNNITAALQAEGVNIPTLLSMMKTAYSAQSPSQGVSGIYRATRIPASTMYGVSGL